MVTNIDIDEFESDLTRTLALPNRRQRSANCVDLFADAARLYKYGVHPRHAKRLRSLLHWMFVEGFDFTPEEADKALEQAEADGTILQVADPLDEESTTEDTPESVTKADVAGVGVSVDRDDGSVTISFDGTIVAMVVIGDLIGNDEYYLDPPAGERPVAPGTFMIATWQNRGEFRRLHYGEINDTRG